MRASALEEKKRIRAEKRAEKREERRADASEKILSPAVVESIQNVVDEGLALVKPTVKLGGSMRKSSVTVKLGGSPKKHDRSVGAVKMPGSPRKRDGSVEVVRAPGSPRRRDGSVGCVTMPGSPRRRDGSLTSVRIPASPKKKDAVSVKVGGPTLVSSVAVNVDGNGRGRNSEVRADSPRRANLKPVARKSITLSLSPDDVEGNLKRLFDDGGAASGGLNKRAKTDKAINDARKQTACPHCGTNEP
jgi:hypothetical protein